MFIPIPLFAFGIGGLFTHDVARHLRPRRIGNGERREGSIYWWMVAAYAGLLSGFIFRWTKTLRCKVRKLWRN